MEFCTLREADHFRLVCRCINAKYECPVLVASSLPKTFAHIASSSSNDTMCEKKLFTPPEATATATTATATPVAEAATTLQSSDVFFGAAYATRLTTSPCPMLSCHPQLKKRFTLLVVSSPRLVRDLNGLGKRAIVPDEIVIKNSIMAMTPAHMTATAALPPPPQPPQLPTDSYLSHLSDNARAILAQCPKIHFLGEFVHPLFNHVWMPALRSMDIDVSYSPIQVKVFPLDNVPNLSSLGVGSLRISHHLEFESLPSKLEKLRLGGVYAKMHELDGLLKRRSAHASVAIGASLTELDLSRVLAFDVQLVLPDQLCATLVSLSLPSDAYCRWFPKGAYCFASLVRLSSRFPPLLPLRTTGQQLFPKLKTWTLYNSWRHSLRAHKVWIREMARMPELAVINMSYRIRISASTTTTAGDGNDDNDYDIDDQEEEEEEDEEDEDVDDGVKPHRAQRELIAIADKIVSLHVTLMTKPINDDSVDDCKRQAALIVQMLVPFVHLAQVSLRDYGTGMKDTEPFQIFPAGTCRQLPLLTHLRVHARRLADWDIIVRKAFGIPVTV